jgi:hypothetical protein
MAIGKAAKKIHEEKIPQFITMVSLEVFRRIVLRTPVDTGRARGNWQIEIGKAAEGVLDILGKSPQVTQEVFDREVKTLDQIKAFSIVHITNNVEYVYYLEYDKTSAQHPEGMVEVTLAEMREWATKI